MTPSNTLAEYRRTQVMGMSQSQLVVMLYQGAIRYLREAIEEVSSGRYDRSWKKFDQARRIVVHLYGTLDPAGGELTNKLSALYAFVIDQITIANARRDLKCANDCIQILTNLKEGWEQLATQETGAGRTLPPMATAGSTNTVAPVARSFCLQA
ncbi:MAG: flagellar export chaperone FliS [candidate division Zixibacteria bacterium]|nr:flagellar export chaperone FliS [candidate division Zixibacteria bacterium]